MSATEHDHGHDQFSLAEEIKSWDEQADKWSEHDSFSEEHVLPRVVRAAGGEEALRGMRVLDFGCGSGALVALLAPLCLEVVGVDVSPKMVENARARLAAASPGGPPRAANARVECAVLDARAAASEAWRGRFDLVVSGSVLHCVPDAGECLAALAACGAPGSRALHLAWSSPKAAEAGVECLLHEGVAGSDALAAMLRRSGAASAEAETFPFFGFTMVACAAQF